MHDLRGTLPPAELLTNIPELMAAYYTDKPQPANKVQEISFGTSGHRGSSLSLSFNEDHVLAMTQAVVELRQKLGNTGPLFLGMDSHALSEAAWRTALEVLAANEVHVHIQQGGGFTPTPVISHAILTWNSQHSAKADGIIITPSHNPPADGGFKYNPRHGGPADTDLTKQIEARANELLQAGNKGVKRISLVQAKASSQVSAFDFITQYVQDLDKVVDMDAIRSSGLKLGADPLGGATLAYWEPIAAYYKLNLAVVNREADPTFRFVPLDHDGKIRMDCSSSFAMAKLLDLRSDFDLAFACDPDADRHGIVTKTGLMNPNHYLAVAALHLFQSRPDWPNQAGLGKTVVTSSMLDRVAQNLGRTLLEVPVGFKWFVPYLMDGRAGLGCEESAGASFLRFNGQPWSTDKDGPIMCLLAAEIMAKRSKSPSEMYETLTHKFGNPAYARIDSPLDPSKRAAFAKISNTLPVKTLAGEPIMQVLTQCNGNPMGGVKVITQNAWFAARPSGTEAICKIYTESFVGPEHRVQVETEAVDLLAKVLD